MRDDVFIDAVGRDVRVPGQQSLERECEKRGKLCTDQSEGCCDGVQPASQYRALGGKLFNTVQNFSGLFTVPWVSIRNVLPP
jgi:hypothetical protein